MIDFGRAQDCITVLQHVQNNLQQFAYSPKMPFCGGQRLRVILNMLRNCNSVNLDLDQNRSLPAIKMIHVTRIHIYVLHILCVFVICVGVTSVLCV
jgi:hypothetical protein